MKENLKRVEELALNYKCTKDNIDPCVKEISHLIDNKREELKKELKSRELKFHNLQLANKVAMNLLYGYMGTTACRFYYTDIAEGITSVGQEESLRVQEVLEKEGYNILYGDTDSMFILVEGMPEEIKNNVEEAKLWIRKNFVPRINEIAQRELEQIAIECGVKNPKLDVNYHFKFKQEMIARSGIFLVGASGKEAKKRYDLWVIDEEGVAKDKFTHAGTPIKQSKLPQVVKDYIMKFLEKLLKEMNNDVDELVKIPHELKDVLIEACNNWELDKIGTTVQYNKPFEEYADTKKDITFVRYWNDEIVPTFKLPEFKIYMKYKFVEMKVKHNPDYSICKNDEQRKKLQELYTLVKSNNITIIPIVDINNPNVINLLKSIFDIDTDYVLEKYVVNVFKPYFLTLKIPVEKILYDFDLDLF